MEAKPTLREPLAERRQFPRLKYTSPIQYRDVFKPQKLFFGCIARDLSAGGVRVTASKAIPHDARLVVLLSLPDSLRQVRAISRVVWQSQLPRGTAYEYGLQFIEITAEDRSAIAHYVERGVVAPPFGEEGVAREQIQMPNRRKLAG